MRRLHAPRAYDTSTWPDSHWRATATPPARPPLEGDSRTEALVIGAGYAGLNAALALASAGFETMVVDAGQPGWGASGRNGGFCCIGGSKLSDGALLRRYGADETVEFRRYQTAAIDHVGEMLADRGIDAEAGPAGEVYLAHSAEAWRGMSDAAEAHRSLYRERMRLVRREELAQEGIAAPFAHGAAISPLGFPLNPMKYVLGLAASAEAAGVRLHGASPVTGLSRDRGLWRAETPGGEIVADRVLIATNGYSSEDLPPWIEGRTLPVFSTILVTRPLTEEEKRAQGWTTERMACDSRRLLHYFRLLRDGRFLFGMRGGLSADPREEAAIRRAARADFEAMFPAWAGVETEREWSGLVCLTGSLTPYAGPVPGTDGLFAAFGWHGGGVAMASYSGHMAGRMMAGEAVTLPAPVATPPKRFPVPILRLPMMRLAYAWYGLRDGRAASVQTP